MSRSNLLKDSCKHQLCSDRSFWSLQLLCQLSEKMRKPVYLDDKFLAGNIFIHYTKLFPSHWVNYKEFTHKASFLLNSGLIVHSASFIICLIQSIIKYDPIIFIIHTLRNDIVKDFVPVLLLPSISINPLTLATHKLPTSTLYSRKYLQRF